MNLENIHKNDNIHAYLYIYTLYLCIYLNILIFFAFSVDILCSQW